MTPTTRRHFLSSLGATAALGLAGCAGNSQLSDLKSRLTGVDKREQRLKKKLEKTQAELNETQDELNRIETQRDTLRTKLYNEREETKTLQQQLDAKNDSLATLETKISKKETRLTELESLVKTDDTGFQFSQQTIDNATTLGNKVQHAVTHITTHFDNKNQATGTGWHLGDGYVLTNAHVIQNADSITLTLFDETKSQTPTVPATILGKTLNSNADIALLKTDAPDATDLPALTYEPSETNLSKGDPLIQVGHPSGVGKWIISLGHFDHYGTHFQSNRNAPEFTTFMPSRSGNSGSPVLTLDGTVVGMTYAGAPHTEATVHAPDTPFTHFTEYPLESFKMHSTEFDRFIQQWK